MATSQIADCWDGSPMEICAEVASYHQPQLMQSHSIEKKEPADTCVMIDDDHIVFVCGRVKTLTVGGVQLVKSCSQLSVVNGILVYCDWSGIYWWASPDCRGTLLSNCRCVMKVHFDVVLACDPCDGKAFAAYKMRAGGGRATPIPRNISMANVWPCYSTQHTTVSSVGNHILIREADGGHAMFRVNGLVFATPERIITGDNDSTFTVHKY